MANYEIIRSKRRTVGLHITQDAKLIVRVPLRAPLHYVEQVIAQKQSWINKTMARIVARPKPLKKQFITGETFLFLGDTYPLTVAPQLKPAFYFNNGFFLNEKYHTKAHAQFIKWYKQTAKKILAERVDYYAQQFGLKFSSIKINSAKSRWGSCSFKGNLNFTWRLVLAPLWVLDYVVAHELAHLKHKNHSKNFWVHVEQMYPNYKEASRWLKQNGATLDT